MERQNYYLRLFSDINILSNILPFLGTTVECAKLLKKTCSKTRQLWDMHKEAISCVILKGEHNREELYLDREFDKQIATNLLKYHNYLLYDLGMILQSKSSYEAINYFLDSIDTRVSDTIFIEIDAIISTENFDDYNKFIQRITQMAEVDIGVIRTKFTRLFIFDMLHLNDHENVSIEYISEVCLPNQIPIQARYADRLDITSEFFCIEELNEIVCLYKNFSVSLRNLDTLYKNKYTFNYEQSVFINYVNFYTMNEMNTYSQDKIKKYLDYIINNIVNLRIVALIGKDIHLDHLICMIDHINQCRLNYIKFIYHKSFGDISQNKTCIKIPNMKFCLYNHEKDKVIVMEAEDSYIWFCSSNCCQNDKYIIIADVIQFEAKSFYAIEDESIINDMHIIKQFYKHNFESFIAIQNSFKISTNLNSRGILLKNSVDVHGNSLEVDCTQNYNDYDTRHVIDTISSLDPTIRVNLWIYPKFLNSIHYTKLILKAMVGKQLVTLNLMQCELDDYQSEIVLKFLYSPLVNYQRYYLNFSDSTYVKHALHAVENRYSFKFGFIYSNEPIPEDAIELAYKILEAHIYCRLILQSKVYALG